MGLFDFFKKKEEPEQLLGAPEIWEIRTDSMDQEIRDTDLLAMLEFLIYDVEAGNVEFLEVKAPYPMYGRSFLEARKQQEFLHIEVGLIERLEDGTRKILGKDEIGHEEGYEIFLNFIRTGELDTSSWHLMISTDSPES